MIIVAKRNEEIWECIGNQSYDSWKRYRVLPYAIKHEVPEGMLWYNLLTREIVLLSKREIIKVEEGNDNIIHRLVQRWYMIPDDVDEKTLVYTFWQRYSMRHPIRQSSLLTLATIFTTTECNARCQYCYEYGTAKNTMNLETAEVVADYIIKNSSEKLMIKWFGGEPLLNQKVMDHISNKLKNSGKKYSAYIVSNGYLFNQVYDEQIKDLWNVRQVQITIDGTKEEYLRIKGLPEDAYEKVLKSIERLAGLDISVMIRIHVTDRNADDLKTLVKYLGERFSHMEEKRRYIHLYVAPLFEGLGKKPMKMSGKIRTQIYDDLIAIDELISSSGLGHVRRTPKIKQFHCMADNGKSIVITPTGDLTPCEHCHDREFVGNVIDGGTIPVKWFERTPERSECAECFYYPQCVKLKMCEAESPCNEDNRRYMRYQSEQIMLSLYRQYKLRRDDNARNFGQSKS